MLLQSVLVMWQTNVRLKNVTFTLVFVREYFDKVCRNDFMVSNLKNDDKNTKSRDTMRLILQSLYLIFAFSLLSTG